MLPLHKGIRRTHDLTAEEQSLSPNLWSNLGVLDYRHQNDKARDLLRIGPLLTLVEFIAILLTVPFYLPLIGIH